MQRNRLHLLHIRDSADKVLEYFAETTYDDFAKRDKTYDAILMRLVAIGESVNELSDEFKEGYYSLPWHKAVGLRNQVAHGYLNIKPEIIWDTAKNDIPELKKEIERILNER